MVSKSKKGSYYKKKTKEWFIKKGYDTEYLERNQRIMDKKGNIFFLKRDLFGSDGLSMDGNDIIFWNTKTNRVDITDGIRDFKKHKFPDYVKCWIVLWLSRAREPEIIDVNEVGIEQVVN